MNQNGLLQIVVLCIVFRLYRLDVSEAGFHYECQKRDVSRSFCQTVSGRKSQK